MKMLAKELRTLGLLTLIILLSGCVETSKTAQSFNKGWRFDKGDQASAVTQLDFDDSDWQSVRLPHDWAITGPFNPDDNGYAGKLPWKGVGWYRKVFTLKPTDAGKRVYLDFDGVMAFPQVYVNGQLAGQWDYGYMSFRVDATDFVNFDKPNIIDLYRKALDIYQSFVDDIAL